MLSMHQLQIEQEIALFYKFKYYSKCISLIKKTPIKCHLVGGCPRGVMVKAMDCGIVVHEFELQSRYYIHFQANTLGKGMNPLSSQLWVK